MLNFSRAKDQEGNYFIDMDLVANEDDEYLKVVSDSEDFEDENA